MGLVINTTIEDGIGISDGLTVQAEMYPVLTEAFDLLPDFTTDEALYITLALDTEQLAPSVHSLPGFNSFADVDGEIYAAGDAGIFKLGGTTDDGAAVSSGVAWDRISFQMANKKRIRAVFLEGDVDNVQMKATTELDSGVYTAARHRVSVGRNLYGRNWGLRLAGFDRLEAVELMLVIGRR